MESASLHSFIYYLGTGCILGLVLSWWLVLRNQSPRQSASQREAEIDFLILAALGCLLGGLLGARLGYVGLHWGYYAGRTGEIPAIWMGGLDWSGSVPCAAIVLFLLCGIFNRPPRPVLEDLLPFFCASITFLWLAAASSSVYYGAVQAENWWALSIRDQLGELHPRVPIYLLAAIFTAVTGIFLGLAG